MVSQYYNRVQLSIGPSQIRTCHFLASGSSIHLSSQRHKAVTRSGVLRPHDRCSCDGSTKRNRWQPFVRLMMRPSRVSIVVPSLRTDDARSRSRDSLAFPASALPDFDPTDWSSVVNGTHDTAIRFPVRHELLSLIPLLQPTRTIAVGNRESYKNDRASLVACLTLCVTRTGRRLRGFFCSLP